MMRHIASAMLLLLAGCRGQAQSWEGYALRDRPGADGTRLIGSYGSLEGCRKALLASDSDASSEAMVCTRGCPPPDRGVLDGCAATAVVRPAQVALSGGDALNASGLPPAGEDRSPDNGSSPL